ncbi:MAG: hypothetical protein QHI48_08870 [Bacteroidota bacterium]|nr:hypothetical protein [Bacteroidota bacterium]
MSEPLERIRPGMTSMDISVYGVRLGMRWEEARQLLDSKGIGYLYPKSLPLRVLVPPERPTFFFTLNPASYEVFEIGVCGAACLHPLNRILPDGHRWRLTTARTFFFGYEGEDVLNEEGFSIRFPQLGFVLKWVDELGFHFVAVYPEGYHPPERGENPLEVTIKYFVTGYWIPNTSERLAELMVALTRGDLREAGIIDTSDADYRALASAVDREMGRLVSEIAGRLARIASSPAAAVRILVEGYADPRQPRGCKYIGETVETPLFVVRNRTPLEGKEGNLTLSRLRAFFTSVELQRRLAADPAYRRLAEAGRVKWVPVGKGEADGTGRPFSERRSVRVTLVVD